MINNCTHQKKGYLIEQSNIQEICDICNNIECIESHKFILKSDLSDFSCKAQPLLTQIGTILYEKLPNSIEILTKKIDKYYQDITQMSKKQEIENLITILQNENQKYLRQLINFYISRDQIKKIKEILKEVEEFEYIIQRCISQFNQNSKLTQEVQTINLEDDQELIQTTHKEQKDHQEQKDQSEQINQSEQLDQSVQIDQSEQLDQSEQIEQQESIDQFFIKSIDIPILKPNLIQEVQNYEIPTTFKFKRMYSVTWLRENLLGIAAGNYNPYIIFDTQNQSIHQQIFQEKNGVYDSILIGNDKIVLAYVHNIKLFQWTNNQFVANNMEFEESQGTPSKLYYCEQTQSIFATNTFFQVIYQNYVYQWKLDSGKLIKYKIQGSTIGPMCLISKKLIFCFSLYELKGRNQRYNLIQFWGYEQINHLKKIDTNQPQYALLVKRNQLFGFGSEITIWNLENYHQIKKVQFPNRKVNPWFVTAINNSLFLGCEDGNIWMVDEQLQQWDNIMKLRAKIMKMNVYKQKCIITALDCSFCIFQLEP